MDEIAAVTTANALRFFKLQVPTAAPALAPAAAATPPAAVGVPLVSTAKP